LCSCGRGAEKAGLTLLFEAVALALNVERGAMVKQSIEEGGELVSGLALPSSEEEM